MTATGNWTTNVTITPDHISLSSPQKLHKSEEPNKPLFFTLTPPEKPGSLGPLITSTNVSQSEKTITDLQPNTGTLSGGALSMQL